MSIYCIELYEMLEYKEIYIYYIQLNCNWIHGIYALKREIKFNGIYVFDAGNWIYKNYVFKIRY